MNAHKYIYDSSIVPQNVEIDKVRYTRVYEPENEIL